DSTRSRVRYALPDLLGSYPNEFTPFIICAFESESPNVLAAACRLLNAVGHSARNQAHGSHGKSGTVISTEFGCAMIDRLSQEMDRNSLTLAELVEVGYRENETGNDQNVVRDIAKRIVRQKSPRTTGSHHRVEPDIPAPEDMERYTPRPNPGAATAARRIVDEAQRSGPLLPPATSTTAYRPLAMYALWRMQALQASKTSVEMFLMTFEYIEEAFIHHPEAARSAMLDTACEAFIIKARAWEKKLRKSMLVEEKARYAWLSLGHPLRKTDGLAPGPWRTEVQGDPNGTEHTDDLVHPNSPRSPLWNAIRPGEDNGVAGPSRTEGDHSVQPQRPENATRHSSLKNPSGVARDVYAQAIEIIAQGENLTSSEPMSTAERMSPPYLRQMLGRTTSRVR
ncbi:hypothetical protein FRB98_005070, partial [Tulasnella sp. 332]